MTAYIITPEQHAQIVEALSVAYPTDRSRLPSHIAALAMLKAMKPVSPVAFAAFVDNGNIRLWSANAQDAVKASHLKPLYAKEHQ